MLQRMQGNSTQPRKYPPELRSFALTLQFYSAKAYEYVRNTFMDCLPNQRTIRSWLQVIDGSPGFSKEALEIIGFKVQECKLKNKKLLCSLVVDEMAIRQQIEWDHHKNSWMGYIDYGSKLKSTHIPVAKEAIVFLLTAINDCWKMPIGFFFINGLTAVERCNLVSECFHFIKTLDIEIVSLTFDGAASNIGMAKELGAVMDYNNLNPTFPHPTNKELRVHVILDVCHMLKNVRNVLGAKKIFYNSKGEAIEWKYFQKLDELQTLEKLHVANRIRRSHIEWYKQKMNVRIAAQTFSQSVGDAFRFLKDQNNKDFENVEPTIEFVVIINNLFDILNSRNLLSKGYKKPLSRENFFEIQSYLEYCYTYLKGIKVTSEPKGKLILDTKSHTGFLGFLVAIKVFQSLFQQLIVERGVLTFIMTYKFSQDHLEIFFSAIRMRNGHNDNPNVKQFISAYRRLLSHNEVKASSYGNAVELENIKILNVSSFKKVVKNPHLECLNMTQLEDDGTTGVFVDEDSEDDEELLNVSDVNLSHVVENIVPYISGFVGRKLRRRIKCEECSSVLSYKLKSTSDTILLNLKNRGGLFLSSDDLIHICKCAEKSFRYFENEILAKNIFYKMLFKSIKNVKSTTFSNLMNHILDQPPMENHRTDLIKSIVFEYLTIRFHHSSKLKTEMLKKNYNRKVNTKMIHFAGN